jgi:hypothetical protein
VVTGKVTDFHHTADISKQARQVGLFGASNQAVVAIQLNVFDLELGRVVASDHVFGVVNAPDTPSGQLYAGMNFDSVMFWSTPLGVASEKAIRQSMTVLNHAVPTRDESIRVVKQTSEREILIAGGPDASLLKNVRFYVCIARESDGELEPVTDIDTGLPLMAKVISSSRIGTTAWLIGRSPAELDLRGASLLRHLPVAGEDEPAQAAADGW